MKGNHPTRWKKCFCGVDGAEDEDEVEEEEGEEDMMEGHLCLPVAKGEKDPLLVTKLPSVTSTEHKNLSLKCSPGTFFCQQLFGSQHLPPRGGFPEIRQSQRSEDD